MAKDKDTQKNLLTKTEILNIRKNTLKKVIYKNKYFNNKTKDKSDLIKQLLLEEKKALKLHQLTDHDIDPQDEEIIHKEEISKILEREKANIYNTNVIYNHDGSGSDDSVPLEVSAAIKNWKDEQKQNLRFPAIPRNKMNEFLSTLSYNEPSSKYDNNLNQCLAHLHTTAKPFWNTPSCIMKAIKDCILHRKWNNLTHLTLMLIHLPSRKSKPLIRHMCQILNKFHPVIEERGLQNQLNIIYEANKGKHL